MIIFSPGGRLF